MEEKARILAVDNEKDVLKALKVILEEEGYSVDVAADGNSALTHLKERKPDLILLDILMPGLDGYEVLGMMREYSNAPVIMLTAVQGEDSLAKALGIGADDYIRKPFRTRELLARIRAKLKRA